MAWNDLSSPIFDTDEKLLGTQMQSLRNNVETLKPQIKNISAVTAANAMTLTVLSSVLSFRDPDSEIGTSDDIGFSDLSLVVPQGATLGLVSGVESEIIKIVLNDSVAGPKLAVVNQSGGNDLSETGFITTVAMSVGADLNNVFYSDAIYTDVSYRVVGSIKSTQTTAGEWAQALAVQGAGGNALTAMSSLGYGQSWIDVTASRTAGVTYYNTSGKPIQVIISGITAGLNLVVGGVTIVAVSVGAGNQQAVTAIIPNGASYTEPVAFVLWSELR